MPLFRIEGPMTARRYITDVLQTVMHHYRQAFGEIFLLADDNAHAHRLYIPPLFLLRPPTTVHTPSALHLSCGFRQEYFDATYSSTWSDHRLDNFASFDWVVVDGDTFLLGGETTSDDVAFFLKDVSPRGWYWAGEVQTRLAAAMTGHFVSPAVIRMGFWSNNPWLGAAGGPCCCLHYAMVALNNGVLGADEDEVSAEVQRQGNGRTPRKPREVSHGRKIVSDLTGNRTRLALVGSGWFSRCDNRGSKTLNARMGAHSTDEVEMEMIRRATVAERLACSPPTKEIRVQSPAGPLRPLACGNRAGRCRWLAGILGDLPLPPPLHSGAAPHSPQSPSAALKISMGVWSTSGMQGFINCDHIITKGGGNERSPRKPANQRHRDFHKRESGDSSAGRSHWPCRSVRDKPVNLRDGLHKYYRLSLPLSWRHRVVAMADLSGSVPGRAMFLSWQETYQYAVPFDGERGADWQRGYSARLRIQHCVAPPADSPLPVPTLATTLHCSWPSLGNSTRQRHSGIVRHDYYLRKSGVTQLEIEPGSPWWKANTLTAQPSRPHWEKMEVRCRYCRPHQTRRPVMYHTCSKGGRSSDRAGQGKLTNTVESTLGNTRHVCTGIVLLEEDISLALYEQQRNGWMMIWM
ncbi:hypothetical protein PR048_014978 [Dryococelus australis]|uniref:Uncharacterized protein n=1 Tax=Dryococelus australis TaxID=614101 RepID=A0ABQ9HFP1_9NEOP|nr:hypothetical protein PR048_014978 [Dryococelus australis]